MRRSKRGKTQQETVAEESWDDPAHLGLGLVDDTASFRDVYDVVEEMVMFSSDIEKFAVYETPAGLVAICQPRYGNLSKIRRAELRERIREDLHLTLENKLHEHEHAQSTAP